MRCFIFCQFLWLNCTIILSSIFLPAKLANFISLWSESRPIIFKATAEVRLPVSWTRAFDFVTISFLQHMRNRDHGGDLLTYDKTFFYHITVFLFFSPADFAAHQRMSE